MLHQSAAHVVGTIPQSPVSKHCALDRLACSGFLKRTFANEKARQRGPGVFGEVTAYSRLCRKIPGASADARRRTSQYRRPMSVSISRPTRARSHRSVLYPCASAPVFNAAIRRFSSYGLSSAGRPVLGALRRLRCPPAARARSHRITEVRLTASRRATSAGRIPRRSSLPPSMRRASNSNRSNRFDIPVLTVSDPIPVKWQRNRVSRPNSNPRLEPWRRKLGGWAKARGSDRLIRWREPEKPERLHTRDSGPSVIPAGRSMPWTCRIASAGIGATAVVRRTAYPLGKG